jgi:hypothetical protein
MPTSQSFSGSTASGVALVTSIVVASILRAPVMPRIWLARCDVFCNARSIENTASSALNGAPSWKTTPSRSLKRQVVGLTICHDTASDGSSLNCLSRLTRPS